jgi:hypothetical protein
MMREENDENVKEAVTTVVAANDSNRKNVIILEQTDHLKELHTV